MNKFYDINGTEIKLGHELMLVKQNKFAPIGTIVYVGGITKDGMLRIAGRPLSSIITEHFEVINNKTDTTNPNMNGFQGLGMKKYAIWSEGYRASGDSSGATLHGYSEGENFKDACVNFAKQNKTFREYFDEERMDYWGCKLFDNECEARKRFG